MKTSEMANKMNAILVILYLSIRIINSLDLILLARKKKYIKPRLNPIKYATPLTIGHI